VEVFIWGSGAKRRAAKPHTSRGGRREADRRRCPQMDAGAREHRAGRPLVLHSDNGIVMRGSLLRESMVALGVEPSFSRPRVSNDNAYAEALFRTAKYCPLWPDQPFDTVTEARLWVQKFIEWYNEDHRHSALKYVTPNERHEGKAPALLQARAALYEEAREANPSRWSTRTRNWTLADTVYLNPERPEFKGALG
jgi:putative transposase